MNKSVFCLVSALVLVACAKSQPAESPATRSLKSDLAGAFKIGAALNQDQILGQGAPSLDFIAQHFSAVTPENEMKWERLQPTEGDFSWRSADAFVRFAQENDLQLTSHALVWHWQTPAWVFEDGSGGAASRDLLLARMRHHIEQTVGRYRGVIPAWDVVNEALNDDGSLRDSKWRQIIGDDYIEKAFSFAQAADPGAQLIYNDYSLFLPEKRAGAVRLAKDLIAKGINLHGIGMQGHYSLDHPARLADIEDSIRAFAALGLDVMITELDVSVLPFPDERARGAEIGLDLALDKKYNPYPDGLPAGIEAQFSQRYADLFEVFFRNQDAVSRVTFWGVTDAQSWRNDWPMRGRSDYPLLFDRDNRLKPAWREIIRRKTARNEQAPNN